jgi:hypothetical protein
LFYAVFRVGGNRRFDLGGHTSIGMRVVAGLGNVAVAAVATGFD